MEPLYDEKAPKVRERSDPYPVYDDDQCLPIPGQDILVCTPSWLGDSIMAMPAVQALKVRIPYVRITVLTPENLTPLWRMNPDVDAVIPLRKTLRGILETASVVKTGCFDEAFVLTHSIRAAFIPFLERIPVRWGLKGYHRGPLLTHAVERDKPSRRKHQLFEYLDIMGLKEEKRIQLPRLFLNHDAMNYCWKHLYDSGWVYPRSENRIGDPIPVVGLIPGAARGRSKQWPAEHFAEVGRRLSSEGQCGVIVFGTSGELSLCRKIADRIGQRVLNMAGKTSLTELAAMLSACSAVVTNDSGGMHLAAAVGAPVVAVFGATDPARTAPINRNHCILQPDGVEKSRSIKRNSARSREVLRRISPEQVLNAVLKALSS
jgi:heptosyltransferase-2